MSVMRLTGGTALIPGAGLVETPVTLDGEVIGEGQGVELDVSGHLVLPGIIDLHGDGFERHVQPRRATFFPFEVALANTDAEMAANGVTTAMLAQSFSWEGGARSPDFARRLVAALHEDHARRRTDLRVQIRYETHMIDEADDLLAMVETGEVGYVVFNDHLPPAERLENDGADIAMWAANNGMTPAAFSGVIRDRHARAGDVAPTLARIAGRLQEMGVPFGSHDDETPEIRARYHAIGARIAEFPTTREAAAEARRLGDPILMGAPNVVRGGSASGNVSAASLVEAGLCDVLVSDYYTPALAAAAWRVADEGLRNFEGAWSLVSTNAADALGMRDRGRIAPGLRADVTVVDAATRRVAATFVAGHVSHLSGPLARRWIGSGALSPAA